MSLSEKIEILLENPQCFQSFTHAEYLCWAEEIIDYLAVRETRSVRRQSIRRAHAAVAKRLKNREYARQRRVIKNDYIRSLETKISELTAKYNDANLRLAALQHPHCMNELFFVLSEEQNLN